MFLAHPVGIDAVVLGDEVRGVRQSGISGSRPIPFIASVEEFEWYVESEYDWEP